MNKVIGQRPVENLFEMSSVSLDDEANSTLAHYAPNRGWRFTSSEAAIFVSDSAHRLDSCDGCGSCINAAPSKVEIVSTLMKEFVLDLSTWITIMLTVAALAVVACCLCAVYISLKVRVPIVK